MNDAIRSFIAIELAPDVREELGKIQDQLRRSSADVKWVAPGNIHLTLKFLGNILPDQVEQLRGELPRLLEDFHPFEITIARLGVFPKPERPRVIWVGVEENAEVVTRVAERIEKGLRPLGFEKETRAFAPHMTLGRVRSLKNLSSLTHALREFRFPPPIRQSVMAVTLFQCTLTPQGPIYTRLLEVVLREK